MKLSYIDGVLEADNVVETDIWQFAWVGKFHADPYAVANQFFYNNGFFLDSVNGEFACIFKTNNTVIAATDKLAQYPIHYNLRGDISIHQASIADTINEKRFSNYLSNWNKLGNTSSFELLLKYKLDDVNLFDDVKQVQRGSWVEVNDGIHQQYHYPKLNPFPIDVFKTLERVVLDCAKGAKNLTLAVGGGWDSYSILAILYKNNIHPTLVHVERTTTTDTECVRQIDKLLGTETIIIDEFDFEYDELPAHSFKLPTTGFGSIQHIQIGKLGKMVNADVLLHASDAEAVTLSPDGRLPGSVGPDRNFLYKQYNEVTKLFNNNILQYQLWNSSKFTNDMDIGAIGNCVSLDPFIDWRMIESVISSDFEFIKINKNIQRTVVKQFLPEVFEFLNTVEKDTRNVYSTDFMQTLREKFKSHLNRFIKICNHYQDDFNINNLCVNERCLWLLRLLEEKNVN